MTIIPRYVAGLRELPQTTAMQAYIQVCDAYIAAYAQLGTDRAILDDLESIDAAADAAWEALSPHERAAAHRVAKELK